VPTISFPFIGILVRFTGISRPSCLAIPFLHLFAALLATGG
jgi:hypothetical protein